MIYQAVVLVPGRHYEIVAECDAEGPREAEVKLRVVLQQPDRLADYRAWIGQEYGPRIACPDFLADVFPKEEVTHGSTL